MELLDLDDEYETIPDADECEDGEWVDAEELGFTEPFEDLKASVVSTPTPLTFLIHICAFQTVRK